jgi:AbrB family looped-hinge helix DNA binding protein
VFPSKEYWVEVDEEGRLVLPPDVREQFGISPGSQLRVRKGAKTLRFHRPLSHLAKVYLELTSRCNLSCLTCIRNSWQEPLGDMNDQTFDLLLDSLAHLHFRPDVFIGGFGEPLVVPDIASKVARLKSAAGKVELITNGMLLTKELSRELILAGVDVLWVSIDGATPEHFADVRLGATLPTVFDNIITFSRLRTSLNPVVEIGISFVAMRKNIADLPALIRMSTQLGASRYMVTNVLPYTQEMCSESLYTRSLDTFESAPSFWSPRIDLPRIDMNPGGQEALVQTMRYRNNIRLNNVPLNQEHGRCPFIEQGSVSIGWDGAISPCLPLMHHHTSYLNDRQRLIRRHSVGNLSEQTLEAIWSAPDYVAFRKRIYEFEFSPCTGCGGCEMADSNEEDCFGNTFPTCGGCLWAQGVIQCP